MSGKDQGASADADRAVAASPSTGLSPSVEPLTGLDGSATSIPLRVEMLPETRAFLRDWLDWVDRGAPEGDPYSRMNGLCRAADTASQGVAADLQAAFCARYPFGNGDFWKRHDDRTMHECPKRLAWARANASKQP